MYQTKILKHYAQPFVLAVLTVLLLSNCRSSTQHSSLRVNQQNDSSTIVLSEKTHGSITSQVQTHEDIKGNHWKITYHFDTSKPVDPVTGLPPTSRVEAEGSQVQQQTERQENVSSETSDSLNYQEKKKSNSNNLEQQDTDKHIESGTSIERSIAAGIIIFVIVIAIILYVRSHPSKQNN